MSSNLSKYDVLKHRHLSLLKALDALGISAKCNNDTGEWAMSGRNPAYAYYTLDLAADGRISGFTEVEEAPASCDVCGGAGQILVNGNVSPCPAVGCKYRVESRRQVYSKPCMWEFAHANHKIGLGYEYTEMYAREWYLLGTDGEVTFHRDAEANMPEWVSEFAAQYQQNRVRNVVFLDGEKTFISQLTNQHCGMFQVPKGCEFVAFDWDRPLEPQQCQPERALLDHMFQCNYSVGVRSDGQAVVFSNGLKDLSSFSSRVTPTITHLLDALKTAILEQSPAKVD